MPDPANKDFTIFAGAVWNKLFIYATAECISAAQTPIDLTGYSAVLGAKINQNDIANVFEITSTGGGIVLGGVAGTINCTLSKTLTAGLGYDLYYYSLYLIDSGNNPQTPLIQGIFNINRQTLPSGG